MTEPYTDEELLSTVEIYKNNNNNGSAVARVLSLDKSTIRYRLKKAAERGMMGFDPVLPGFRVSQTSVEKDEAGHTVRQFVQQKPEHGEVFAVPEGHVIKGISALVDTDGRQIVKWIKTREEAASAMLLEQIKASLSEASGHVTLPPPPIVTNSDLLAFYPIADVHLGAFAWREETGNDYDLKIAERVLKACTGELIARSAPAEKAIVLDMGDFFHGDNTRNQTSKSGNPLDIDSRHPKVVKAGFMTVIWIIEQALQKHQHVTYRKLAGNHDEETSPTFALGIWAWFRNNPRVEVDISPCRMWKHRFGKTLLTATHGDMMKMADLGGWLAATHPKDWGEAEYRYGWTGHIHNKQAISSPGMLCESLNSPAARDAWHAAMGFTAPRNMISITYDINRGERDRLTVAVRP